MEEHESVLTEGDEEEHIPVGSELMEWAEIRKWQQAVETQNE